MAIGKVVETRSFIGSTSKCWEVADYCIANKIYLIFTPCINRNDFSGYDPMDTEWKQIIDFTCRELIRRGGNRDNCRLSLINEPMKYISKERYAQLINIAYPIIHNYGFLAGAGNEEFLTAQAKGDMYQYILANCNFDILDVHVQGSCNTAEKTEFWCNTARSWTSKPIDCTEAFYADIATSSGWNLLNAQQYHTERIGCENFCMVFTNLDRSMFPWNTSSWDKLCFNINGNNRSGYWGQFLDLIEQKAPVPNLPIIEEDDDMKLEVLKPGSNNNQVRWLQEILMLEYGYPNDFEDPFDGKYGNYTRQQVEAYQEANGLVKDGYVGVNTTLDLLFDVDKKPVADRVYSTDYWDKRLKILVAFD